MSEGMTVFQGRMNDCITYLSSFGLLCPERCNPVDFVIDIVALDTTTSQSYQKTSHRINSMAVLYNQQHNSQVWQFRNGTKGTIYSQCLSITNVYYMYVCIL
jgi:hypothetical protein